MRVEIKEEPKGVRVGDLPVGALFRIAADSPDVYVMTDVDDVGGNRTGIKIDAEAIQVSSIGDALRFRYEGIVYPVPPPELPAPAEPKMVRLESLRPGDAFEYLSGVRGKNTLSIVNGCAQDVAGHKSIRITHLGDGHYFNCPSETRVIPRPDLVITNDGGAK